ncbi:lytic transglycosylase domain-containing protein [Amorphus sp. 3PC139-8]|uniref:lytic transglycosylase domain-containing protein n=1 Tax=Amorphus sp. 3PC139-8 TaxID=2735676 RepID=UPI00345DB2F4
MDRMTVQVLGMVAVATLACPSSAVTEPAAIKQRLDRWQPFIAEASARFAVPALWIRAVIQAESAGRTMLDGRPITSSAGAMGLMQVMPDTYDEMRRRHGLGGDPHDPRDNILAGTAYLRALYERFGFPGLFSAYNAGPRRYQEHLTDGRSLPRETRAYLARLDPSRLATKVDGIAEPDRRLFFPLHATVTDGRASSEALASQRLFVPLRTVPDRER